MPYKSEAQRKYMHWAAKHHKDGITESMVKEFDRASKGRKLPKKKAKKK